MFGLFTLPPSEKSKEIEMLPIEPVVPSTLTDEEIRIIQARRLDARYDAIVNKIENITPITYEKTIYKYGRYDGHQEERAYPLKRILTHLPVEYLEALEAI